MAEQHAQGNGDADAGTERRFSLEKIYIKDLSFEVPNAPSIYADEQTESNIDMNLKNSHQIVKDDLHPRALRRNVVVQGVDLNGRKPRMTRGVSSGIRLHKRLQSAPHEDAQAAE